MSAFLFLIQLLFILILSRWLLRHTRDLIPSRYFAVGLGYKLLAGWGIGLLYAIYYQGGDTWAYYQDAAVLTDLFWKDPLGYFDAMFGTPFLRNLKFVDQPRALFFAKLSSILGIFSLNNYWLISLSFSAISFFASWWFMVSLKQQFRLQNYQVLIPFLFYPSVALWSSSLLKESLALALIYLLTGIAIGFYFRPFRRTKMDILRVLAALIFGLILCKLKYYYAAVLIPSLLFLLFLKWLKSHPGIRLSSVKIGLVAFFFFLTLLLVATQLHPNLNPDRVFSALVLNHDLTVAASLDGSYVAFPDLEPKMVSMLKYMPKAVWNGLFAPLPILQGTNILHLLAGLENLMLLIFTLWAVLARSKNQFPIRHPEMLGICLFFIFTLAWMITIASPNFGSLIRYRVAYMPFFLLLILLALKGNLRAIFSQFRKKT